VSRGGPVGEKRGEGKKFDGEGACDFLRSRQGEAGEGAGWRGAPHGGARWVGPWPNW
jgi:hypothetical protein